MIKKFLSIILIAALTATPTLAANDISQTQSFPQQGFQGGFTKKQTRPVMIKGRKIKFSKAIEHINKHFKDQFGSKAIFNIPEGESDPVFKLKIKAKTYQEAIFQLSLQTKMGYKKTFKGAEFSNEYPYIQKIATYKNVFVLVKSPAVFKEWGFKGKTHNCIEIETVLKPSEFSFTFSGPGSKKKKKDTKLKNPKILNLRIEGSKTPLEFAKQTFSNDSKKFIIPENLVSTKASISYELTTELIVKVKKYNLKLNDRKNIKINAIDFVIKEVKHENGDVKVKFEFTTGSEVNKVELVSARLLTGNGKVAVDGNKGYSWSTSGKKMSGTYTFENTNNPKQIQFSIGEKFNKVVKKMSLKKIDLTIKSK